MDVIFRSKQGNFNGNQSQGSQSSGQRQETELGRQRQAVEGRKGSVRVSGRFRADFCLSDAKFESEVTSGSLCKTRPAPTA
ncbi:hypothetical protein ACLOJK_013908 [Asimina triloba]